MPLYNDITTRKDAFMDNPYSPTFCVYPWMEMLVGPVPWAKLCCIASDSLCSSKGQYYSMAEYTPEEIWNSEGFREVRKKMLEGKKLRECSHCYYQESVGKKSYRESFNKEWLERSPHGGEIKRRVEKSRVLNFQVDSPPLYLDIRPGNKCNLKCRMCSPGNSSQIFKEQEVLVKEGKLTDNLIETSYFSGDQDAFNNWHKNPRLWDNIDRWIPGVKKLYFTGGEPTLIEKNWQIIDKCIKGKYSHDVTLTFNINCTYVPDRLLNTFHHFSSVELNLSVDGHGGVQEYIRHPSKWKIIERNIERILERKTDNVIIFFSPVVQVYNILSLTKLLRWIESYSEKFKTRIRTSLIICTGPQFFDIASLPMGKVREEAIGDIEEYRREYHGKDGLLLDGLNGVENILKTKKVGNTSNNGKKFFEYTKILDTHRKNDFFRSLPRLGRLLQEDYGQRFQ